MTARPQTLVCLTTSAALGGAETSLLTLLAAFRRLEPRWAISVIVPGCGPLVEKCAALGIDAAVLAFPAALRVVGESGRRHTSTLGMAGRVAAAGMTVPRYVAALRQRLRACGATVVHSNGFKTHVAGALAKPRGVRLVWHLHDYVRSRPISSKLLRALAPRAAVIVANSDSVLADVRSLVGPRPASRRIYNAVDPSVFRPDGSRLGLSALAGLPDDSGCTRVGLIATRARWKGHGVFLDALARLDRRGRVRAYIIGGPVYETAGSQWSVEELQRMVRERGLGEVVGLTGHLDDVPAALRSLDVVVHASTAPEPFGLAIAEAMASGRAVVAARQGGASELFTEGVTALGHAPGDAAELASQLATLVSDAGLRERLGAAAREAACARFMPERMAREFREVYGA